MTNFADRVRAAQNIQEAVLVLAEGIDAILAREDAPADGWELWTPRPPASPEALSESYHRQARAVDRQPERDEAAIARVREALQTASDEDDIRALEARLRLLEDDGSIVADYVPEGTTMAVEESEDEILLTLPTPDAVRLMARREWAKTVRLGTLTDPPLDEEIAADAYAKGGPLWLYHGARELLMSFPRGVRAWMVTDVEQDSPRTAQELGRDILKGDAEDSRAVGLDLGAVGGSLS